MIRNINYIVVVTILFLYSCGDEPKVKQKEIKWTKDQSSDMNKNFAIEEELDIKIFLANRKTWKTIKTGSGLRYYIYHQGSGRKAETELEALVRYKINLLDGTLCYQTDSLEVESFKIDKSDIETGVQEGIKKMKIGDKAKLIVPSHLAHGLLGDRDKIPPLTVLVIDIELLNLR
ncbi:MAG: FKBP-type peptidyl-prolyl cis-trans isomerase [Bacteroidota bacterium]